MSYDAIITAAAAELERRQRAEPRRLYVVAHPTTAVPRLSWAATLAGLALG